MSIVCSSEAACVAAPPRSEREGESCKVRRHSDWRCPYRPGRSFPGVGGWRHASNLRDLGSGVKMCYPARTREADDSVLAFAKFLGPNTKPSLFYSDTEGGLVVACRRLAFQHRLSRPGRLVAKSLAERANQDILQGARTIMVAAGLPGCFWTYVAPFYCLMESLTYNV